MAEAPAGPEQTNGPSQGNPVSLTPPHGLQEILETFGDIYDYIRADGSLDPRWQSDSLARLTLPFPLRLSWDPSQSVVVMTCHRRLVETFATVFAHVQESGLESKIVSLGGCFSFRPQRGSGKLSAHAWGIAIDLNPESNAQGTAGDMDAGLVEIFRGAGFEWGGEWAGSRLDPMHFQFCTGY